VPFLRELLQDVDSRYPGLELSRRIHELVRRVITRFVEDAVAESGRRLSRLAPGRADDIRAAEAPVVAFSDTFREADAAIKAFLHPHMYRHPRLLAVREEAERVLRELFNHIVAEPGAMPEEWQAGLSGGDPARLKRRVADYIAGMTDRYALLEHRRLVGTTPDLSF
jgi:dGTPase